MKTKGGSVLDCLAAAYRWDLSGQAYVQNIADEAAKLLDRGLGVLVYTYNAHDTEHADIDYRATSARFDPVWLDRFYAAVSATGYAGATQPTGFEGWGHMLCAQASAVSGMRDFLPYFRHIGGSRDTFAMNALDASGRGLWIGAPLKTTRKLPPEQFTWGTRLAAHLTAAMRMRRNAGVDKPKAEAVMAPGGALLHGEKHVVDAREELRRAALAFDGARTAKMRRNVDAATRQWRPLVDSRWSLLDDFDTDGRRFVVAVENTPPTRLPRKDLSEREHQVMTHAHLGHSDKVIAYELGLSHSTVRVLLHRAMKKLGAATRKEAIARFTKEKGRTT